MTRVTTSRRRHLQLRATALAVLLVAVSSADFARLQQARAEAASGTWTVVNGMAAPRVGHTATRLHWPACEEPSPPAMCGRVVVVGGRDAPDGAPAGKAELYDPVRGSWEATAGLLTPRSDHTATLLPTGKVLVVAGRDSTGAATASVEIFDPLSFRQVAPCDPFATPPKPCSAPGTWAPFGQLSTPRWGHTATLLPDGRVLVTGGTGASGAPVADAEVLDVTRDLSAAFVVETAAMSTARSAHTATLVSAADCDTPAQRECTKVLVVGGRDASGHAHASAELFDPAGADGAGTWERAAPMGVARSGHAATSLGGGKVLVAGGSDAKDAPLRSAELFDVSLRGAGAWHDTAPMAHARSRFAMTRLEGRACQVPRTCGRVLVSGGSDGSGRELASAELFDPEQPTWQSTGSLLVPGAAHAAALLTTGHVIVTGGTSGNEAVRSAEVFDPSSSVQPPSVSAVAPTGGALSGGSSVVIAGAGFTGATRVSFGDVPAAAFSVEPSGTRIRATAPPHPAATVDVTVATPVRVSVPTDSSRFTYAPPPTVTAISPIAGPAGGGTEVTVTGTDLGFPEISVRFGGVPAVSVRVLSNTEVVAVAPPHPPGDVDVVVIAPTGRSTASFATRFTYGDGAWAATGKLGDARYLHSATLLRDGAVLVAGGTTAYAASGTTLSTAELYRSGTWRSTGGLNHLRYSHTATLLDGPKCRSTAPPSYCGNVLVAGGERHARREAGMSGFVAIGSSELYVPEDGAWKLTKGELLEPRFSHTATLLDGPECHASTTPSYCGKVLVAGGSLDELGRLPLDTAELYDPETETWSSTGALDATCTPSSSRFCGRTNQTATLLADGKVLVAGGIGSSPADRPPANRNLVSNIAEITAVGADDASVVAPSARSRTVAHTVVRPFSGAFPVLGVLVSAIPGPEQRLLPGMDVTYTLAYFNSGRAPAKEAVIIDSLPEEVEFVEATGGDYDYDEASHSVRFRSVAVPAATTASRPAGVFHVTVRVRSAVGEDDVIANTAQIDSGLSNTVSHRVSDSHLPPELGVVLSAQPVDGENISPGDQITYSLSYFNTSDSPVSATIVSGPLPEMVSFVSWKRSGEERPCANCTPSDVTKTFTVSSVTVPPRTSAERPAGTYEFTVAVHPRANHAGPVLLNTAEVYDAATGEWTPTKPLVVPRFGHTATLLDVPACGEHCGKVLVVGGAERLAPNEPVFTGSAELYDPARGEWTSAHALRHPRAGHSATLLPDGQVLVAGSSMVFPHQGLPPRLASAEVFDPVRSEWRDTAPMLTARGIHTATLLDGQLCGTDRRPDHCGIVLVAGGAGPKGASEQDNLSPSAVPDAERYRPAVRVPAVLTVVPAKGPSAGGTSVVIDGGGFTGVSAVRFGELAAKSFRVESRGRITAVAPAQAKGTVDVTVTADGGRSSPAPGARFTYSVSQAPGRVTDLVAHAVSSSEVSLAFSAPPSDAEFPPPAERYVVKQALAPIVDEAAFAAATTLCDVACTFSPRAIGDSLSLSVTELTPGVRYHYALRAVNEAGQAGPISNRAFASTPSASVADTSVATTPTSTTEPGAEPQTPEETRQGAAIAAPRARAPIARLSTATSATSPPSAAPPSLGTPEAAPPVPAAATPGDEKSLASPPRATRPVGEGPSARGRRLWRTALLWSPALLLMAGLGAYLNRRYRPIPTRP